MRNWRRYFKDFSRPDFAKAGAIPTEDLELAAGPLAFPASMIDQLRKLGLVLEIDNGELALRDSYVVTQAGVPINPEQAKLLHHLNKPIVEFKINLQCVWTSGKFEEL